MIPLGIAFYRLITLSIPVVAYVKISGASKKPEKHAHEWLRTILISIYWSIL